MGYEIKLNHTLYKDEADKSRRVQDKSKTQKCNIQKLNFNAISDKETTPL